MKKTAMAAIISAMAMPAIALDPMPEEAGFGGFVNLGVGAGSIESNFLARVPGVDVDLSSDTINGLGSPDDESIVLPAINYNLGWTFADKKTRVFLGSEVENFLRFESSTMLAVRHDFDNIGNMQLSLLASSVPGVEVWADPYLQGENRSNTEFSSTGGRFTWNKIFGSNFEIKASTRKIDIDNENSGAELVSTGVITAAESKLLDREGDVAHFEVGYTAKFEGGTHLLRPAVAYIDRDLDGDAMSQDGVQLLLQYAYNNSDIKWVNSVTYLKLDGDKVNPIFNKKNDEDAYGIISKMFFPGAFGLENWTPNVGVVWADADADIDFNSSKGWMVNAGMFYEF
jgi:hypothetical protein